MDDVDAGRDRATPASLRHGEARAGWGLAEEVEARRRSRGGQECTRCCVTGEFGRRESGELCCDSGEMSRDARSADAYIFCLFSFRFALLRC